MRPLHELGMSRDGVLQILFGALVCAGIGYGAGRLAAEKNRSSSQATHERGAVVGGLRSLLRSSLVSVRSLMSAIQDRVGRANGDHP
jgi:hypothetical protein